MGARSDRSSGSSEWHSNGPAEPNNQLSDRLSMPLEPSLEPHPSLPPPDLALLEKLNPAQLRAVASWMRAIAGLYEHQAPAAVGHSFRVQASHLDHLARQIQPADDAVVGTLMSATLAYWVTATGGYWRQALAQASGEADSPAELCDEAAFLQAYLSSDFTVLLGAEYLAQRLGAKASRSR